MPNPDGDGDGKNSSKDDKRSAVALMVPAADPPTLEKEERGVPQKRKCQGFFLSFFPDQGYFWEA
jgi:hypothetical protein